MCGECRAGASDSCTCSQLQLRPPLSSFGTESTRFFHAISALQGDGNIRYFELVDEEPFVHFLAEHRTNVSTKVRGWVCGHAELCGKGDR